MESITAWLSDSRSMCGFGHGSGDGNGRYDGSGRTCFSKSGGYGHGYKYGSGYFDKTGEGGGLGYDDAAGHGSGDHVAGFGFDDGAGFGDCYGHGGGTNYGLDITEINGTAVYQIDSIPTAIEHIKGNIAKGKILNCDLTWTPCFIVKQDGLYAHGENLRQAMCALSNKMFSNMPIEKRIAEFWHNFKPGVKYPAEDYFLWHYKLTGSCEMGRQNFAETRGIDLKTDMFTPEEFISMTKYSYFGYAIRMLEKAMPAIKEVK